MQQQLAGLAGLAGLAEGCACLCAARYLRNGRLRRYMAKGPAHWQGKGAALEFPLVIQAKPGWVQCCILSGAASVRGFRWEWVDGGKGKGKRKRKSRR